MSYLLNVVFLFFRVSLLGLFMLAMGAVAYLGIVHPNAVVTFCCALMFSISLMMFWIHFFEGGAE